MPEGTNVIRHEHVTIRMMVQVLDEMLMRHETAQLLRHQDLSDVVKFFLRFGDRIHHAKEETVLFPLVLRRDPALLPLLDTLMIEHQRARACLEEMELATRVSDAGRYFTAVSAYVELMRAHVQLEDSSLLTAVDRFLTAEAQHELAEQLLSLDSSLTTAEQMTDWAALREQLAGLYLKS